MFFKNISADLLKNNFKKKLQRFNDVFEGHQEAILTKLKTDYGLYNVNVKTSNEWREKDRDAQILTVLKQSLTSSLLYDKEPNWNDLIGNINFNLLHLIDTENYDNGQKQTNPIQETQLKEILKSIYP